MTRSADELRTLHDELCARRAWPRDEAELAGVERELHAFPERSDLKRFRRRLEDSGIAGTELHVRPYFEMARWIAREFPERVRVDWTRFDNQEDLLELLPLLLPRADSLALDSEDRTAREWVERLCPGDTTDGAFLVERFVDASASARIREHLFERLDPPFVVELGPGTPSRTLARHPDSPVVFGREPTSRPRMPATVREAPLGERRASDEEGASLLALARASMLLRDRDLDGFAYGNREDVLLVDWPHGLQIVVFGMQPDRRLLLESCFGHLVLQNGVPVGYGSISALHRSVELAYNIFPAFRGHGAPWVMARLLGTAHHLFGATSFVAGPYQLGHDNEEGIRSGAWWYYEKLGFRPDDQDASRLRRSERRLMRDDPRHRTSRANLRLLAEHPMFLDLEEPRRDALGRIDLGAIGDAVSAELRQRGGSRETALRRCVREARALLEIDSTEQWTADEKAALQSWAPLVLALPGVRRWSPATRRSLSRVVLAKGGGRQRRFVERYDRHPRLRQAIAKLAET